MKRNAILQLASLTSAIGIFASVAAFPSAALASNSPIGLQEYLGQVRNSNTGVQGSQTTSHGYFQASYESELPFSTQFFGNVQYTDDNRQTLAPIFQGNRSVIEQSQAGIRKLFDFGLQTQLSYGLTSTNVFGVSPTIVPQSSLITGALTLQLTQSFWQNGFGKADRALRISVRAQDLAQSYQNSYQTKVALSEAESRYWSLAVARELVKIEKESYDRTVVIRDINSKRASAHLIDESDLLTSQAQAKAKEFDLKSAFDKERVAARSFNSARGVDSDSVDEFLRLPSMEELEKMSPPQRAAMRDDVKAAEQSRLAVSATSEAATQRQLPSLNLVGTASTNGLEPNLNQAVTDTTTGQYPYYAVGVNFTAPLDFHGVRQVKQAYAEQLHGAELTYRRRLFDQENDWKDLTTQFNEAKQRLTLAFDVERAQKSKFQHESLRRKQGASTTYQVFQFEIDYLSSELNRIQTEAIILTLMAQMKTFGGEP